MHELSSVAPLRRQHIGPREFGVPWLRRLLVVMDANSATSPQQVAISMRNCLVSTGLRQAGALFPTDAVWQSTVGQLQFKHLTDMLSTALASRRVSPKVSVLSLWA